MHELGPEGGPGGAGVYERGVGVVVVSVRVLEEECIGVALGVPVETGVLAMEVVEVAP